MQKEKRSFERFQGVEKTWVNRICAETIGEFSQAGKLLKWRVLVGEVLSVFSSPALAG
jgi:hypothetical protein